MLGVTTLGLVTYNRWAYYRAFFGVNGIGFNVEVLLKPCMPRTCSCLVWTDAAYAAGTR